MIELNDKQREAVNFFGAPLLIIAGAGSGKTMVLTHKIAKIIKDGLANPENILGITFTNKAAKEMKSRVQKLVENQTNFPFLSTFHAFCGYILRNDFHNLGRSNRFVIYDTADQKQAFKHVFSTLKIDEDKISQQKAQAIISLLKNDLVGAIDYENRINEFYYEPEILDIYRLYQQYLERNNAIDFDDMLFFAVKLFQEYPQVLDKYQEQFKYILIDEYQDTNQAQYRLAKLLTAKYKNICVVGDFDQNIYTWRGANVRNILEFEKDYEHAKIILLEQNYRSTKAILNAANGLIEHNQLRKEKTLWTQNKEGEDLSFFVAYDEREEADFIASEIRFMCKNNKNNLNDFVILYRTNAQSRIVEDALNRNKIAYRLVGGVGFYSRREIKDMLSYLRVIYNHDDNVAFCRALQVPQRGIGQVSIKKMIAYAEEKNDSIYNLALQENLPVSKTHILKIRNFILLIDHFRKVYDEFEGEKLVNLIEKIIVDSGYQKMLEADNTFDSLERLENVRELVTVAKNDDQDLANFLNNVSLLTDLDEMNDDDECVTLMTLHNAKGLEFDTVFLIGMEEGLLPHYKTQFDQNSIEEERRLCYVGLTRAKKNVYLTAANRRSIFGDVWFNDISRFVKEIPKKHLVTMVSDQLVTSQESVLNKLVNDGFHYEIRNVYEKKLSPIKENLEISKGDLVEHKVWGQGTVIKIDGAGAKAMAHIDFNNDVKVLMLKYAPIKPLSMKR